MKDFIKKWQEDKKFRAKIKLLLYFIFIVFAIILARGAETNSLHEDNLNEKVPNQNQTDNQSKDIIVIPKKYQYQISVMINDKTYQYSGIKDETQETIIKEADGVVTNYLFKANNYYKEVDENYLLTTKDEIYAEVNYSYLDLNNINLYLNKAQNDNHQYLVPLKDIILGDTSEEYFTITLNSNKIDIDYTPLVKRFNNTIYKYNVLIVLEENE